MNKNIAAFLRVDHTQLTDFCPIMPRNVQQSAITNLPTHLGIEWRSIDNDITCAGFFPGKAVFTTVFVLRKSYLRNSRGGASRLAFSTLISSFFLAMGRLSP